MFTSCNNHLGDTVTVMDTHLLPAMVYEKYTDLTTVISIDGARAVQHSQTMLCSQAASRSHLRLVPLRKLNAQAGGYFCIGTAAEHQILIKAGGEVGTGTQFSTIDRKQCFRSYLDYMNLD